MQLLVISSWFLVKREEESHPQGEAAKRQSGSRLPHSKRNSAHFRQMISPLPLAREYSQDALQSCRVRRIVGERKGLAAGPLGEAPGAQPVCDVKTKGARLAGAP